MALAQLSDFFLFFFLEGINAHSQEHHPLGAKKLVGSGRDAGTVSLHRLLWPETRVATDPGPSL